MNSCTETMGNPNIEAFPADIRAENGTINKSILTHYKMAISRYVRLKESPKSKLVPLHPIRLHTNAYSNFVLQSTIFHYSITNSLTISLTIIPGIFN